MSIRIVLADDHIILREGLCALLESHEELTVVGETDNGRELLRLVSDARPDVAIIDVALPELNGIEATRKISANYPDVKVLGLSILNQHTYVSEMLCAGAVGYLSMSSDFSELVRAIETVVRDKVYIFPTVAGGLIKDYVQRYADESTTGMSRLTPREREVLQLLAEGKNAKQIATLLRVSHKTVEAHRLQIKKKLGLESLAELTKFAIREGLTTLEP